MILQADACAKVSAISIHFNVDVNLGLVACTHLTPLLEGDGEDGMGAAAVLLHLGGPYGSPPPPPLPPLTLPMNMLVYVCITSIYMYNLV